MPAAHALYHHRDDASHTVVNVMRLVHKLFLVMTAVSIASIVLFAVNAHWQFNRGFRDYLEETRRQHLELLAGSLAPHYDAGRGWRSLSESPRTWRQLVRSAGAQQRADSLPHPPPPARGDFRHGGPRGITLYDPERRAVIGKLPFEDAAETFAVAIDGQLRGWLGVPPLRRPPAGRDQRFAARQFHVILFGAGLASALSLVAAIFFARRVAGPVSRAGRAVRQLAGGDLETRVALSGSNELQQLGDDVNILARTLRRNESARRRYFADISHELRTPLAILRGEIDAVRDGVRDNDERLVDSIDYEVARLESLIEDLYQLARADIGSLQYEFTRCSPAGVVRDTVVRFANRFEQHELWCTEELDASITLTADPARLAQLLENLLENCCRYVAGPGRIRVRLAREHTNAVLRVEDSGPAPAASELEALFEPLRRGDASRNREAGGAGLGLAICRAIATAHGGEIRAENSPLKGLAVIVTLPLESRA